MDCCRTLCNHLMYITFHLMWLVWTLKHAFRVIDQNPILHIHSLILNFYNVVHGIWAIEVMWRTTLFFLVTSINKCIFVMQTKFFLRFQATHPKTNVGQKVFELLKPFLVKALKKKKHLLLIFTTLRWMNYN